MRITGKQSRKYIRCIFGAATATEFFARKSAIICHARPQFIIIYESFDNARKLANINVLNHFGKNSLARDEICKCDMGRTN